MCNITLFFSSFRTPILVFHSETNGNMHENALSAIGEKYAFQA